MSNKSHEERGGFAGPGYSGFGGSAGYSGSGAGGVAGGYAGGGYDAGPWRPVPDTLHDDRIESDVRERLQQAQDIDASAIVVSVEAGVVMLEGEIETREMKLAAGDIAERVPGVQRVHNQLHVQQTLLDQLRERLNGPQASRR